MLILVSATISWIFVDPPTRTKTVNIHSLPVNLPVTWALPAMLVAIVAVLVATFRQHLSCFAAPIYALAEGVVLGSISRAYSDRYQGIVVQAVGATLGVFVVMLLMYRSGVVRVNDKYRRVVMGAMMGLMGFYLVSWVIGLFGPKAEFISNPSAMGILFSIFVAGLAASNLAIDFDMIERGVANKLPAHMEWFCALGVTVTLVWLYLEILRLLSKLRDR
jgi:uncharacterized YccA/Bax inhibitor family protein